VSEDSLVRLEIGDRYLDLEYALIARDNPGPLLIFLHEGLGSVALWRTFPQLLCEATGCRGLVYSRCAYGRSSPFWPSQNWPVDFMQAEGRELLPKFLSALGIDPESDPPVLVGHSDGASIALIYAAIFPSSVAGVVAMAPHIFVEPLTIASIAKTRDKYLTGELSARLAKYHNDIQEVFWGWTDVWLRPAFKDWNIQPILCKVQCPVLLIQGWDDDYGTMAHVDGLLSQVAKSTALKLRDCGHSPHLDQTALAIEAIGRFLTALPRHPGKP
jgi:pimeloyl-ACP methyl ester carboxylesterase